MQSTPSPFTRKLSAALVFIALVLLVGHELELYLPDLEAWIKSFGVFAPVCFILLFTVLTPLFVSVDLLCFAAGVLFPIATAEIAVIIATYLSATVIYFLGRDFFRAKVVDFVQKHPQFKPIDQALSGKDAFRVMFLLRLTPLPFAMLSYALSVTGVTFQPYLGATTGILIYNASLAYFGYATKHLTGLAQNTSASGFLPHGMLFIGLCLLIVVLIYVAKMARDKLKDLNMDSSSD